MQVELYNKKVTPPFKPKVKSESDVSRVDDAFLNEAVCFLLPMLISVHFRPSCLGGHKSRRSSFVQAVITPTPNNAVLVSKDAFKDFTFAESSGIALSNDALDSD